MKEIKSLYRAIASASRAAMEYAESNLLGPESDKQDGLTPEEEKKRCRRKKGRCEKDNPRPTSKQKNACILNVWNEEFGNAPWDADPMDILCAAYRGACNCEVDHEVKKCEWHNAMAACMGGPGDGSPKDAPCPVVRPFDTNTDCSQITDDTDGTYGPPPRGYCSKICWVGCGNPEDDCGLGSSDPGCAAVKYILLELNKWDGKGRPPTGDLRGNLYGEYRDCIIGADSCEKCDCKKTLADKLKNIAEIARRIAEGWGCRVDLEYNQWYDTFDVDECKSDLDCGLVEPNDISVDKVDKVDKVNKLDPLKFKQNGL